MSKDITVGNFSIENIKNWISGYSHKQKVEFAVYCAGLVIDLYTGNSDAPRKAIAAAKAWIADPSDLNKTFCENAAYAAADAAADAVSIKGKIISYITKKLWTPQTNTLPLKELSNEQAAELFNEWRGGSKIEVMASGRFGETSPMWRGGEIYRIKPKSSRELFIEQAVRYCKPSKEQLSTAEAVAEDIFDAIKSGQIKAPEADE